MTWSRVLGYIGSKGRERDLDLFEVKSGLFGVGYAIRRILVRTCLLDLSSTNCRALICPSDNKGLRWLLHIFGDDHFGYFWWRHHYHDDAMVARTWQRLIATVSAAANHWRGIRHTYILYNDIGTSRHVLLQDKRFVFRQVLLARSQYIASKMLR